MNMMNGYKRKKYVKIICFIGIAILLLGYMCSAVINHFKPPIGRISGAEMDFITIDGCVYEECNDKNYSIRHKGKYLGKVVTDDEKIVFRVYSVKGTDEYIYRLWDWEGGFYKKVIK